jgi:hypothetical protein
LGIDNEARRIETFAGEERDTVYRLDANGGWRAWTFDETGWRSWEGLSRDR